MKKLILILTLILFNCYSSLAQDDQPEAVDSTSMEEGYSLGNPDEDEDDIYDDTDTTEIIVEFDEYPDDEDSEKNLITRWFTLGLGMNPVMADGSFDLPDGAFYQDWKLRNGKSTNVDLGIVQQKLNLSKHKLYLFTGLGFDINKYMFEDDFFIDDRADTWITTPFYADTKKNRLTATYLHVPLMLNFETDNRHYDSFRINAGMYGSLRMSANQKIKFKDRDDNPYEHKEKYKNHDDFNLRTFVYGIKGEVGYGPVNIYTKYQLVDLFDKTSAPPISPMSFGIMIIPF